MEAKQLAFRYLYKSGVVKENTVTVFGELGSVFKPGIDYDEEVQLTVPYMDLSNLIMYFSGTVVDGTVGSSDEGSLRNLNAPVSNVRKFMPFTKADHATEVNHYYIGDIVLYDPITGNGTSVNASCWTCIRTTSDLLSPIPELTNEIFDASAADTTYNTNYKGTGKSGPGMTGIDNRGQRFIVGVLPAVYDPDIGDITPSPYWRESALAKSYLSSGNYYQGELVVYNGGVYQCKSTNGFLADPQLYQRVRYTTLQEEQDAAGIVGAIPPLDNDLAPNGAFGYDSSGTRYLMGVPPTGGLFSGLFWEPATLPKVPSGAYLNINWDNSSITEKLQFYDANVPGGGGAQSIPAFNDDTGNTITTLRKVYDDNEKNFVLTTANQILASIPAAAIKSQSVSSKVQPDNTLVELVHLGPSNSKPSSYTPAVQGVFEESVARDMLRIAGYANTVAEIVVTDGSSGYTSPPNVQLLGGLATNPKLVPFYAAALPKLGVKSIKINKLDTTWSSRTTGKRYSVGEVLTFVPGTNPDVECIAKVYRVDLDGNILSVLITNKGSGYVDVPPIKIAGITRTFLTPVLEVVSVGLQYRDVGFYDGMKVVVQYGSGAGAVGYAVTETINGQTRLVEVKFDATSKVDPNDPTHTFDIRRGTNYVAGKYKRDIVGLQGFTGVGGSPVTVPTARSIGVVLSTGSGGAISTFVVINNGSGYTSNPSVVIGPPAADPSENASLGSSTLTSYLPPINNRGVYLDVPPATFTVADPATSTEAVKVGAKTYLGVNAADVKFGGQGFSVGEYMNVSGGGITPAKFRMSFTDGTPGTYSALVMEGGDGYSFDSAIGNGYKNQIVLNSGGADEDELLAEIKTVGGGIVELTFNNGTPSGENFVLDDVVEVTPSTGSGTPFRFKVTSVGPKGTISQILPLPESTPTGYAARQVLSAQAKHLSVDTLKLDTPQVFTLVHPTVTIEPPTAPITGSWSPIQAEATVLLKVGSISVSNGGTGFQQGDVIRIRQPGARSCEAFVLAIGNTETGSVGIIGVSNSGSGFDLSKTGSDAIVVELPTTSGDPLIVNINYVVDKIVVTQPGSGYTATPVAQLAVSGSVLTDLNVTTRRFGGSTATFLVSTTYDPAGTALPELTPLSRGEGYIVDDLLELTNSDATASGLLVKVVATQSNGVRSGLVLAGYRGTKHIVDRALITGTCTKVATGAALSNVRYAVTKLTSPTSISSIEIVEFNPGTARYPQSTVLSHKPHARIKVGTTDSLGGILTLTVESPGYGYTSLPNIKPVTTSRGTGASLFAISLGVSRVEFTGAALTVITSSDILVSGDGIVAARRKPAATAIAQLTGDLNTISTDPLKNPNILETLESLKPGSTSGYAQAKPNMGVSSVEVVYSGRNYPVGKTSGGQDITYVEVTEPDLPNGVKPTFEIFFDGLGGITNVVVLTSGSGYSQLPKALIKELNTTTSGEGAFVKLNMKLLSGFITSGGEGYKAAPAVVVTDADVTVGNPTISTTVTMRTSINGFNIESPGAQYLTTPEALIVGPGNGAEALASMGVSDIYVVNGGIGYSVGDMLQISAPTGTNGACARATVLEVVKEGASAGAILRVGLVSAEYPIVVNTFSIKKNNFVINGGSGYTTLPTILPTLKVPAAGDLYDATGVVMNTLADSTGAGATFSTRLGVSRLDFTTGGTGYESDATVLIQSPPSSQAANYSAVINAVGQVTDYIKTASGSGYTRVPGISIDGSGTGATMTPLMGVTEVTIIDSGAGYRVGDTVRFVGGNPIEEATGVVTVIDRGGSGIGYDLSLTPIGLYTDSSLSVDSSGNLIGVAGAIRTPLIIEGGYEFEIGDIISIKPETRLPTQEALNSIRTIRSATTISGGKLMTIGLVNNVISNDFKAGMILKVTPGPGSSITSTAVAYIQVNVVLDDISGSGWHTINNQLDASGNVIPGGAFISGPGDKYGKLVPALWYDYDNAYGSLAQIGLPGDSATVLASNEDWGSDITLVSNNNQSSAVQKLTFEVVTQDEVKYPGSTAYFKITQVLSSVGAIIQASPCDLAGAALTNGSGLFYSVYDRLQFTGLPRGRLSFIQVLNSGSGYTSNPTAIIASPTSSVPAKTVTTLGVVSLRIDNIGRGYAENPTIKIQAPDHRALTAKGYARSGVFDIDGTDSFEVIDQGSGYTGQNLLANATVEDKGVYRLVGGALHQTGGAAESIDTVLEITPSAFTLGKLSFDIATISAAATTIVRGSNYRVGDIVSIMPIGTTTSDNQASPARIRIKSISKILDKDNGMGNNAQENTGVGILDYSKRENDEDVGAYGTGYFEPPSVRILGGNQGVTLDTSLGLVAVDFIPREDGKNNRGTNYQVGDLIQMVGPEFSRPVDVGVVSEVDSGGAISATTLYEPFSKGLRNPPTIIAKRTDPTFIASGEPNQEAEFSPVLGVTVATTTTSTDGFIGRPYVSIEPPNGRGYIFQPTSARITPNLVNEVFKLDISYDTVPPEYTVTVPRISLAPPPFVEKYSGWRSVRFNKQDSFEAIVQYTIAKAISFQVDPDATLPGYYFTASSIKIGGVDIPLRQSGGKGMQGRELSANRIIRRYKVKLIAV
jgi:hypothetical protein